MQATRKVIIADESREFAVPCASLLKSFGVEAVLVPKDGEALYEAIVAQKPQAVLCDVFMPHSDAIGVMKRVREEDDLPQPQFMVLSGFDNVMLQNEVMQSGARYYFLKPFDPEVLAERDALWSAGKLEQPMFEPAWQFAAADKLVIAAPFWDMSFPAILKIYLERISVTDLTFGYSEEGAMVGLCRASKLLYITTRGGNYAGTPMETATPVLKALCTMYGIPEFQCLDAEGLDDIRNDKEALLADAARRAEALAEVF